MTHARWSEQAKAHLDALADASLDPERLAEAVEATQRFAASVGAAIEAQGSGATDADVEAVEALLRGVLDLVPGCTRGEAGELPGRPEAFRRLRVACLGAAVDLHHTLRLAYGRLDAA